MNILSLVRENAQRLEVTPADDASEYRIDYGEGVVTVEWSVGDEKYSVDISFMTFHGVATTYHERYDPPVRGVEFDFSIIVH